MSRSMLFYAVIAFLNAYILGKRSIRVFIGLFLLMLGGAYLVQVAALLFVNREHYLAL